MKIKGLLAILLVSILVISGCSSREGAATNESSEQPSETQQSSISEESSMPQESSSSETQSKGEESSSSKPAQSSSSQSKPTADDGDWQLRLVSAKYPLPAELDIDFTEVGGKSVDSRMADSLKAMIAGAKKEGYNLTVISGYRTFAKSRSLFESKVQEYKNSGMGEKEAIAQASKWVAPPGTSEHHTGLAADIITADYYSRLPDLLPEFEDFPEAKWMKAHAHEYGFILRFPKGKEKVTGINFEPWHFRYVGKANAKAIYEKGLTLEEYLGK